VRLTVVTEMEVRSGVARNPKLRIAELVEEFLAGIAILPLDSAVARTFAQVRADLAARGTPIGPLDLMIGSHTLSIGATLVTNNVKELGRIEGLRVRDWTR
jgi:tRNA(fMet)-specific endonuclease VapC